MRRLIDKDALYLKVRNARIDGKPTVAIPFVDVFEAPEVDAVPVVRCGDCKHCIDAHDDGYMYCMRPIEGSDYNETGYLYPLEVRMGFNNFCSYGERRAESG